jgi:hypothetical protein
LKVRLRQKLDEARQTAPSRTLHRAPSRRAFPGRFRSPKALNRVGQALPPAPLQSLPSYGFASTVRTNFISPQGVWSRK